jgi:hypothetical protein
MICGHVALLGLNHAFRGFDRVLPGLGSDLPGLEGEQAHNDNGFALEHSPKVTAGPFLRGVHDAMYERAIGCHEVRFGARGELIIPSAKTIAEAVEMGELDPVDCDAVMKYIGTGGTPAQPNWLRIFQALRKDPVRFARRAADGGYTDLPWDFDWMMHWCRAFRVLRPIHEARYAREYLLALERNGFEIGWEKWEGGTPPYACSCGMYMHYAACKHALAQLWDDEVVLRWPRTRDPTRTGEGRQRGRPALSRARGALGRV